MCDFHRVEPLPCAARTRSSYSHRRVPSPRLRVSIVPVATRPCAIPLNVVASARESSAAPLVPLSLFAHEHDLRSESDRRMGSAARSPSSTREDRQELIALPNSSSDATCRAALPRLLEPVDITRNRRLSARDSSRRWRMPLDLCQEIIEDGPTPSSPHERSPSRVLASSARRSRAHPAGSADGSRQQTARYCPYPPTPGFAPGRSPAARRIARPATLDCVTLK